MEASPVKEPGNDLLHDLYYLLLLFEITNKPLLRSLPFIIG
jgi:hypothetical protein